MELERVNWFALAGGALTLFVVAVSLFVPWWQLTVGEDLMRINVSPVNTNFGLFGSQFTIPLIWALNIISVLTLTSSGVLLLLYSVTPAKSYAHHLLGFAYKKPLFAVVFFLTGLLITTSIAGIVGIGIPLIGSATMTLPSEFTMGVSITATVSGNFQLPFWLAIVAVMLCLGARLYHMHVSKSPYQKRQTPHPNHSEH